MSEHSHPNPSVETLREMTGAPNLDEAIVSENGFKVLSAPSARPLWKLPLPKLALIGMGLLPVFGLAAWFLLGGRQDQHYVTTASKDVTNAKPEQPNAAALDKLQRENARLQTNAALDDQVLPRPVNQPASPRETSRTTPAQPSPVASSPATSPVVSYRPTPPQIQSASLPAANLMISDRSSIRPSEQPTANPVEQWQQLAQLGSYGAIATPEISPPESRVAMSRSIQVAKSTNLSASSLPMAQVAPISAVPEFSTASSAEPIPAALEASIASQAAELEPSMEAPPIAESVPSKPLQNLPDPASSPLEEMTADLILNISPPEVTVSVTSVSNFSPEVIPTELTDRVPVAPQPEAIAAAPSEPPILAQAEAVILQEPQVQSLVAGTSSPGKLASPVLLDNPEGGNRYPVILSEPLLDHQGRIALPAGSQMLVQVDRISASGVVELSATEAIVAAPEGQRELMLPQGVILIRGEDGKPLVAEHYRHSRSAIAGMDVRQFALGAIRRTAELYTRSNSRVQTSSGTTVITESNPEPNILAGALEGGTDAILDPIAQRNQQAIEQMQNHPTIPYIKAGTHIQIFVNQSMQMPM